MNKQAPNRLVQLTNSGRDSSGSETIKIESNKSVESKPKVLQEVVSMTKESAKKPGVAAAPAKNNTAHHVPPQPASLNKTAKVPAPLTTAHKKTRVVVECDVGFGNTVHLRGEGAGLSWDKGALMKCNAKGSEWVLELDAKAICKFKALLNDNDYKYEEGENHQIAPGGTLQYMPRFPT